ncbi:MAG: RNA pyrophosphohydrolase [Pseudomonadota bacterium]
MTAARQRPHDNLGPRFAALNYRPCVGIMLVNQDNAVFVGQRLDRMVEAWQMPQGGIDKGEMPMDAARRELEEEIGTAKADVLSETADWLAYDLPDELQGKVWGGRYRGQIQKWYLMRFTGDESDININTADPEFRSWRWTEPANLVDLAVPFKRGIYAELIRRFGPLLPG